MAAPRRPIEEFGFHGVFEDMRDRHQTTWKSVLADTSVLTVAQDCMASLQPYRELPQSDQPGSGRTSDEQASFELYALSRINDLLLAREFRERAAPGDTDLRLGFFTALGFEAFDRPTIPFRPHPYSPFHHEIVDVSVSPDVTPGIRVRRAQWAGLRFGNLLFARAGVAVEVPAGVMNEFIAERSVLYFAYVRPERRTMGRSQGWGHNSQWRMRFHRFYESANHYHFNVDGFLDISSPSALAQSIERQPAGFNDPGRELSLTCRQELLIHRHFVRCRHADKDLWPWDDTLTLPKDSALLG